MITFLCVYGEAKLKIPTFNILKIIIICYLFICITTQLLSKKLLEVKIQF